jgi:ubiquinone/menaquinone biosynthesis C-methylase UbiE
VILDLGCGTGRALIRLASESSPDVQFVGIDPAENMCNRALERARFFSNIEIHEGSFAFIPRELASAL